MGKIKILPDTLISQIAAGEVVERPASVVKELIENSIDAGATMCSVEIEQGGMKLIAVRDNGCGMSADDAKMAFERHATSKIEKFADLAQLQSFGFRGEALAAIASVSFMTMRTREDGAESGCEIIYKAGKMESQSAAGCPVGTEITVQNLFYQIPARKKFLKAEQTEFSHIVATVMRMALSVPSVGFELKHNGRVLFNVASARSMEERISSLLGNQFLKELLPVEFETESIHIYGFTGQPGMSMKSKRHQYLFINHRDVTDGLVSHAVSNAYGSRIPGRTYPVFILNIDINPEEVDVNVHPRKLQVKFLDTQRVYRDVSQAVAQVLDGFQKKMFGDVILRQAQDDKAQDDKAQDDKAHHGKSVQQSIAFSQEILNQEKRPDGIAQPQIAGFTGQLIGQIANSYLLIFDENGLAIVDQHAAHERILYEKFKNMAQTKTQEIQQLAVPFNFECNSQETVFMKEALACLRNLGFEIEEWSGNTFAVHGYPAFLRLENPDKLFRNFLDDMMNEKGSGKILPEKILKSLACKAAVKFGMKLAPQEQQKLLGELAQTQNNSTCPHGRPTKILLTFEELERRFYRTGR